MLNPGTLIYNLTILKYCGGGAFGEVYYAQDISGKKLALKIVPKASFGSAWERELKGITNYRKITEDTPELLKIYHVGEDEQSFFYTMEPAGNVLDDNNDYLPDTLAQRLAHGPISPDSFPQLLKKLLDCIVALHRAGFAHRDIKPENILFVKGTPKLADLGLLSPLTGSMTQLAGTLDYLPPEIRNGSSTAYARDTGQRNDLYAFGKIIYCCITGNNANEFPSFPKDLPLVAANKHFFRLACRLCDKVPSRRLNSLADTVHELNRAIHLGQTGETLGDKTLYCIATVSRNAVSLCVRSWQTLRRHWLVTLQAFGILAAAGYATANYFATRPDKESEELARTLHEQRETEGDSQLSKRDFTFYNNTYTVAIPSDWTMADYQTIQEHAGVRKKDFSHCHGIFLPPKQDNTNADTVISAMILPLTKEHLDALSETETLQVVKTFIGTDIEIISQRKYKNGRNGLDTILITGRARASQLIVSHLYPQKDHTLALVALLPESRFDVDMGKYLAITDSLQYRFPNAE